MPDMKDIVSSRDLERELKDLTNRDWQLWSIGLLVLLVLATGFVTLGLPGLHWVGGGSGVLHPEFMPQLISGFIVLIGLLNAYLLGQKRRLDKMRDALIRSVMGKDGSAESSGFIDRLTKVFGRQYGEVAIERELARADRNQVPFTLALFDVAAVNRINREHGTLAGDYLLLSAAQLLKKTFRGADAVCRLGGDQFLAILPETTAAQAEKAFVRVAEAVRNWNTSTDLNYQLQMCLGTSTYFSGASSEEMLAAAKTSLQTDKRSSKGARKLDRAGAANATTGPRLVADTHRDTSSALLQ